LARTDGRLREALAAVVYLAPLPLKIEGGSGSAIR
jgi:hypothetical protein